MSRRRLLRWWRWWPRKRPAPRTDPRADAVAARADARRDVAEAQLAAVARQQADIDRAVAAGHRTVRRSDALARAWGSALKGSSP
jgi:hypothetical protein